MGILIILFAGLLTAAPAYDAYAPLRLYDGPWSVAMHDQASGKTTADALTNTCSLIGSYFSCQQVVNGKVSALVVFVPAAEQGQYYIQNVLPDGSATGRSELAIAGSHWIYSSTDEENGKKTWYRTVNDFTGPDHIHFESAQSTDGKAWTVVRSGDEVRGIAVKR